LFGTVVLFLMVDTYGILCYGTCNDKEIIMKTQEAENLIAEGYAFIFFKGTSTYHDKAYLKPDIGWPCKFMSMGVYRNLRRIWLYWKPVGLSWTLPMIRV